MLPWPALGRLDRFDAIGPRPYGGPRALGGIRALLVFKNTQCNTTQSSRTDFVTYVNIPKGPGYRSRHSDSLRAARSGDRIPVGARHSALVQTGPEAHPASCTMGTGSLSQG